MSYYWRHDEIHLETDSKIGEPGIKKETDIKSLINQIRAEKMRNTPEKKETYKHVETAR